MAKDVAEQIAEVGGAVVDAPVSGGVVGAEAATLSFMVGGSEEAFKRAEPYFALMGKRAVYCGKSGNGLYVAEPFRVLTYSEQPSWRITSCCASALLSH